MRVERWFTPLDRRIVALAVPALATLVVEPLYNLTDTAIVGHLGAAQLGGIAIASTVLNLIGWCAAFVEMATTSQVSFRLGRGDPAGAGDASVAAYAVAAALGLALAVAVATAGPPIAAGLGASGAVLDNASTYLRIAAVGMPFLLLTFAGTGQLQGHADTRTPLKIVLLANVVNVALELVLVYGAGLGIAGSAWGTVIAQAVGAALFLGVGARRTAGDRRLRWPDVRALVSDGWPLVVRTAALGSALVASTAIAARVSTPTLGGHQIALQVWLLLALTLDALAVPAQVFVSSSLGAGDPDAAVEVGRRCLRLGLVVGTVVAIATMAVSGVLPALFSSTASVRHLATQALLICGALQPFAAVAFVLDGLLLGAQDYRTLRRAMILALFAFIPLAAATLLWHRLGIVGIWLALTAWLAGRCLLLGRAWRSRRWTGLTADRLTPA